MINAIAPTPPAATPLVTHPLAPSVIAYLPADTVAPSVASARINPNAKGHSSMSPNPSPATAAPGFAAANAPLSAAPSQPAPITAQIAQTHFFAHLLTQDLSAEAQAILVQYEKLIHLSNVKYKPSNAFKPAAEPSGLFSQLLRQEMRSLDLEDEPYGEAEINALSEIPYPAASGQDTTAHLAAETYIATVAPSLVPTATLIA